MKEALSERQSTFLKKIEQAFQSPKWFVDSYSKIPAPGEQPESSLTRFKYLLLDFAMNNNLYFLEKTNFIHIGRSHNVCELSDLKLNEHLQSKELPAKTVARQGVKPPN